MPAKPLSQTRSWPIPDYEITIKYDDEGALSARGAAEHFYSHLLADMFYRSLTLEVRNKKTGEVETVELKPEVRRQREAALGLGRAQALGHAGQERGRARAR